MERVLRRNVVVEGRRWYGCVFMMDEQHEAETRFHVGRKSTGKIWKEG
jgi:hypothetical protein